MKIPKGMTEQEVVDTINKVVNRYAHRFRFGYYDADDIKQEAFIIAMEALDRYDNDRPLENFLAVHVKNRLSNFKRDKFFRRPKDPDAQTHGKNDIKKFLMEPLNIENIRDENEVNMSTNDDFVEAIDVAELFLLIDQHLPITLRADYLRMMHGVYVPKPRREQIHQEIINIFQNHHKGDLE